MKKILILACVGLAGCGGLPRRGAVPAELTQKAQTPGVPDSRMWSDNDMLPLLQVAIWKEYRDKDALLKAGKKLEQLGPIHFLALSGGGDDGAFGAGLLVGWTKRGDRPEFTLVSGISAGALIAPFAFVGPKYDPLLRKLCTTGPKDIFRDRGVLAGALSDGMMDHRPLEAVIAKYITPELLSEIAAEYEKGRALLIGTTDLDADRGVIWNMGAIASSKDPRALRLFRDVLLASMAIPGLVSPVMIDVELEGKAYQEMHVDGGVMAQVILYPSHALEQARKLAGSIMDRKRVAYIVRNSRLDPSWTTTKRRTSEVARRAVKSLIEAQGVNDLYRLYALTQKDKVDFNLAYIGPDFSAPHPKDFDPDYMRSLFEYGYRLGEQGYAWKKAPPEQ